MLVWLTLPFYDFCGFRSVAVNTVYKLQFFYIYHYTRSHVLFTSHLSGQTPVYLANDIKTLSPTIVIVCCSQLPPGHASSHEYASDSATEASALRTRVYGTVSHPNCARTSATNSLSDFWKHFYLGVSWPRLIVTIFIIAPYKYSYSLTNF